MQNYSEPLFNRGKFKDEKTRQKSLCSDRSIVIDVASQTIFQSDDFFNNRGVMS